MMFNQEVQFLHIKTAMDILSVQKIMVCHFISYIILSSDIMIT